jgi:hypothetical protein
MGQYMVGLINGGKTACANLASQIDGMSGAEIITDVTTVEGDMKGWSLPNGNVQITCSYESGDISIVATK